MSSLICKGPTRIFFKYLWPHIPNTFRKFIKILVALFSGPNKNSRSSRKHAKGLQEKQTGRHIPTTALVPRVFLKGSLLLAWRFFCSLEQPHCTWAQILVGRTEPKMCTRACWTRPKHLWTFRPWDHTRTSSVQTYLKPAHKCSPCSSVPPAFQHLFTETSLKTHTLFQKATKYKFFQTNCDIFKFQPRAVYPNTAL